MIFTSAIRKQTCDTTRHDRQNKILRDQVGISGGWPASGAERMVSRGSSRKVLLDLLARQLIGHADGHGIKTYTPGRVCLLLTPPPQPQEEDCSGCRPPARVRCRANSAHLRQSRPDSGSGFQAKVLQTLEVVPSSLGRGQLELLLVQPLENAAGSFPPPPSKTQNFENDFVPG